MYMKKVSLFWKQLEKFAQDNEIPLEKGWKVDFSRLVKNNLLKTDKNKIDQNDLERWKALFEKISI